MITLKHDKLSKVINVPTSVNEITPEVLDNLTENIKLSDYYALVALCWKVSFGDIFFNKKNSEKGAQVIPLLAKKTVPEKDQKLYEHIEIGKKLILSRSAIEMGVHIHVPNAATINSISDWLINVSKEENPNAKGMSINILPKGEFILVEFKAVPLSQIVGVIDSDTLSKDPFLVNE